MKNAIFYEVVLSREISSVHVFSQPIRNHTLVSHQVKFDPDLFYKLTTVRPPTFEWPGPARINNCLASLWLLPQCRKHRRLICDFGTSWTTYVVSLICFNFSSYFVKAQWEHWSVQISASHKLTWPQNWLLQLFWGHRTVHPVCHVL